MSDYRIGLLCEDEDYGRSLQNYFTSKAEHYFLTVLFTNESEVIKYLEDSTIDLLVSDMNIKLDSIKTVYLEERRAEGEVSLDNEKIYRYQKASDILKYVYKCLREDVDNVSKTIEAVKMLAVYSPVGRSGKTSLAHALCENNYLEKNIYIGMELFGECEDSWGMDSLIYHLKQRDDNIVGIINDNIATNNHYGIIGSAHVYTDVLELNYQDMMWLVEKLKGMVGYSKIVFDIDVLSDLRILELFDEIYMPILKEYQYKVDRFEDVLDRLELSKVKERIKKMNSIYGNDKKGRDNLVRR